MIKFRIVGVNRKSSNQVNTIHFTYNEKGEQKTRIAHGAEWEELELAILQEEKPTIQIGNIVGSAFFLAEGSRGKSFIGQLILTINDPQLLDVYKVGDIIEFTPTRLQEPEPKAETPEVLSAEPI